MCNCPNCGHRCTREEDHELPVACPICGADLYTEELTFLDLLRAEPEPRPTETAWNR